MNNICRDSAFVDGKESVSSSWGFRIKTEPTENILLLYPIEMLAILHLLVLFLLSTFSIITLEKVLYYSDTITCS